MQWSKYVRTHVYIMNSGIRIHYKLCIKSSYLPNLILQCEGKQTILEISCKMLITESANLSIHPLLCGKLKIAVSDLYWSVTEPKELDMTHR